MRDGDYKFNGKTKSSDEGGKLKGRKLRDTAAYSFLYVGDVEDIKDEELNILKFNADAYKEVAQNQISIFDIEGV